MVHGHHSKFTRNKVYSFPHHVIHGRHVHIRSILRGIVVHHSTDRRHSSTYAAKNYKKIHTILYLNKRLLSVFRLCCHIVIATTRIILDTLLILACSLVSFCLPDLRFRTILSSRIRAHTKLALKFPSASVRSPFYALRHTISYFHYRYDMPISWWTSIFCSNTIPSFEKRKLRHRWCSVVTSCRIQ